MVNDTVNVLAFCLVIQSSILVVTVGCLLYFMWGTHDKNTRANTILHKDYIAQADRVRSEMHSVLRHRPVVRVITNKEDGMFLPTERRPDKTAEQELKDADIRRQVDDNVHSGVLG